MSNSGSDFLFPTVTMPILVPVLFREQWLPDALSSGVKVAAAWNWPLASIWGRDYEYLYRYLHTPYVSMALYLSMEKF